MSDRIELKNGNIHYHWNKVDWHGGQKSSIWYGLSMKDGKYYCHFYQNLGTMYSEIQKDDFYKQLDEWMKKDEFKLQIIKDRD